ncbi:MAG: serine hydrolase, partial [Planctomycetota bacterium]
SGGGGLVSTVRDYARFCSVLIGEGKSGEIRLLKAKTLQLMYSDQLRGIAGDFQFGLGFKIQRIEVGSGDSARKRMQYSWAGYASTDFRVVPEERLIQIFVRQEVPSSHTLANELFRDIYQGLE